MKVYPDDFEAFWKAYPTRKGPNPKAEAHKLWVKAAKTAGAGSLVTAAERFAREIADNGVAAEFVPHARTWLRQERYLDYLQPHADGHATVTADQFDHPLWPKLRGQIGNVQFRAWLLPLQDVEIDAGRRAARIVCPSQFHLDHVRAHYEGLLCRALGVERIAWSVADGRFGGSHAQR